MTVALLRARMCYKSKQRDAVVRMHNASGERRTKVTVSLTHSVYLSVLEGERIRRVRKWQWQREKEVNVKLNPSDSVCNFVYFDHIYAPIRTHTRAVHKNWNELVSWPCVCDLVISVSTWKATVFIRSPRAKNAFQNPIRIAKCMVTNQLCIYAAAHCLRHYKLLFIMHSPVRCVC